MRSRDPNRPSGGPGGDVRVLTTLSGTQEKGDRVLYWNSLLKYMETWVMIRPSLISSIILLPQCQFSQTWYLRKATMEENLTAPVVRFLKKNSPRTSGFTEGSINQP